MIARSADVRGTTDRSFDLTSAWEAVGGPVASEDAKKGAGDQCRAAPYNH